MWVVSLMSASQAADLPDPWKPCDQPCIGPAPVPVMEQMFWVQLSLAPDVEVDVVVPEGVRILDRTKPGKGRTTTRIYLRADRGMANAQIVLTPKGGDKIVVPLTVKTYREDIEENLKALPGLEPSARKQGRSYYTDDIIAIARENMKNHPSLVQGLEAKRRFDDLADDELWKVFPSWNVPRDCYSNWPCPKCGEKIYEKSGFYPWGRSYAYAFKCKCPVCGELFPSNDYMSDDFTSGDYPDDGWGYDAGNGDRAQAAAWIANYNHHNVWQEGGTIQQMALRYLLLGDEEAAHRVGVLLARIAYVYPGMNYRWQQARPKYLGRGGRALVDGNWERNNLLVPTLRAYDAIFDYIDKDTRLVEFLHAKDPAINSPADVKALFDTCLVQVFGWDWMRRELSGGSQGSREQDLAEMIVCANMGAVSDRWLEEMFTHAWNGGQNKGGFDDATLVNALTREGHTLVSGTGYAIGYLQSKSDMAEILSRVQSKKWAARCNLYDEKLYPKLRAEYDLWIDMLVAGRFAPQYGDSGAGRTVICPNGFPNIYRTCYERAYRRWPSDRIARAIYLCGKRPPQLFEPDVWPDVEAQVAKVGPELPLQSRVIDGAGFVMLESRPTAEQIDSRVGIAFRYGYGVGHQHNDNLNVEVFSKGESLAPELGYPCWAHPLGATGDTAHHCTGMIDRSRQYPGGIGKGWLEGFAGAPEASFADVAGAPVACPNRMFRRAVCLADAPGDNAYLLDVLRLAGGTQRTYCFHGPMNDNFATNLQFGPKSDDPFALSSVSRSLNNNIVEPQQSAADGDTWADWKCRDKDVHIRLDLLGRQGRNHFTARYAKTDVPDIRFLFAEDTAEDGASEFIAIWQPYAGAPFIEKIERLAVEGDVSGEFKPVALRVAAGGGQVDTLIYTHHPEVALKVGDIEFQGSFGYWSELNGKLRCLHLVNGRRLARNGQGVVEAVPNFAADVTAADLENNAVTLSTKLPVGKALAGQMIYLRFGPHRTAYHIVEVMPPGNVVKLDLNSLIYRSNIEGVGEDKDHLLVEMPFVIPDSGGPEPFSYYDGAFVTGEDFRAAYRVKRIERPADTSQSSKLFVDRPLDQAEFPDADGDGRKMLFIYDFGPGDKVTVQNSVFVDFAAGRVTASGDAQVVGM